jgi:hypothetical protein
MTAVQLDIEDATPRKKQARKELTVATPATQVPTAANQSDTAAILGMIERIMVDPNASVERANQAFEFYQRVQADQARRAFSAAMVDAKSQFTPIVKRHLVEYGEGVKKTSYKHEDLADISAVVDPVLSAHGLSYRHRATSNLNEPIKVTCVIEHRLGYSEETTLTAGSDGSGGKNSIQAIGSTLTYLQRYTLRIALGLATGRDDDGKASEPQAGLSDEQIQTIFDLITETNSNFDQFLIVAKVAPFEEGIERDIETIKAKIAEIKPTDFKRLHDLLEKKKTRGSK